MSKETRPASPAASQYSPLYRAPKRGSGGQTEKPIKLTLFKGHLTFQKLPP